MFNFNNYFNMCLLACFYILASLSVAKKKKKNNSESYSFENNCMMIVCLVKKEKRGRK